MGEPLSLEGLSVAYGATRILRAVDLEIPSGKISALVGPNGCGKSTLLKAMRRLLTPLDGIIRLERDDIASLSETALARRMALLTQAPAAPDDLTVFGVVRLGRYAHQTFFRQWNGKDAEMVENALAVTGLTELRDRRLDTLSGGQRQRVWFAMALAQDTPVICLDEPINHLDVAHQLDCLDLVKRLNRRDGKTVVIVLHDLNLAARFADRLVVMKAGRIVAQGAPRELVTPELMRDVFNVDAVIVSDPIHGSPLCIASRSIRRDAGSVDDAA